MNIHFNLQKLIFLAGFAQVGLVIGSLSIPRLLNWRSELAKVQPLIKQMFWTYAAYILVVNLCFGLISIFDFKDLSNGSTLAIICDGFIAAYWISRVLIQFFYFDRTGFPKGNWYAAGEIVLVALFIFLGLVYSYAGCHNYQLIG
jgi:hypothetical protein